jgi:hypothetical protein
MNHPAALTGQARLCRNCEDTRAFATVASPLIYPCSLATTACEGLASRTFAAETRAIVIDRAYEIFKGRSKAALITACASAVVVTEQDVE